MGNDSRVEERTDAIDASSTILQGSCNSEILKKLFENMMDLDHGQAMESEAARWLHVSRFIFI